MDTPKVSIILPTYNVAKFLPKCLNSISAQTYKNIEVLIIIDGATDGSYEIAQDFAKRDGRFHVFWQENTGSGPARNNGIDRATGEFIMFVDPDDWCKDEYVETMVRLIKEGDYDLVTTKETAVYFNKKNKQRSTVEYHADRISIDGKTDVRKNYVNLLSKGLISAPHCKIYRSKLIKENFIRFPALRRSQDVVFNYRYYNYIDKILVSDYSGYMYRVLLKDRLFRLPIDYYITIKFLYGEMIELHKIWNIPVDRIKICTDFYTGIQAHFESNVVKGISIKNIVEDPVIYEIIQGARPEKTHFMLTRWLALHKYYRCTSGLILLLYYIKSIIH